MRRSTLSATTVSAVLTTVRGLIRPRTSFDRYTSVLMQLYKSYTQELFISGFDPGGGAERARGVRECGGRAAGSHGPSSRSSRTRRSYTLPTVWSAMLAVFERATNAARSNPVIRAAFAEFESFMAHV